MIIRYLTNFLRFSAEVPRDLKHRLSLAQDIFKEKVKQLLSKPIDSTADNPESGEAKALSKRATKLILEVKQRLRELDLVVLRRTAIAVNHD